MQTQSTFIAVGWDFVGETANGSDDIWYMDGYPALACFASVPIRVLTVENGSGDGSYAEGTDVAIAADAPPSGQLFDRWTTDPAVHAANLADAGCSATVFTMPAADVTLAATYIAPTYAGGSGTVDDPYRIATKGDLLDMAANTADYDKHFAVTADIDLAGEGFTAAVIASASPFTGSFDGGGHVIRNLSVDASASNAPAGLFGRLSGAVVANIGVRDATLVGGNDDESGAVGVICASNIGTIRGCYATGAVSGRYSVGGLCGLSQGTIEDCYAAVNVNATGGGGGLCGFSGTASFRNCFAIGFVQGPRWMGGFCGGDSYMGTFENCFFYAVGGPDNGFGAPLDAAQFADPSALVGFDFAGSAEDRADAVWVSAAGYCPRLSWQPEAEALPLPTPPSTTLAGEGSVASPFLIQNCGDLDEFGSNAALVGGQYALQANLDLTGTTLATALVNRCFGGVVNGNSHTISHLTIDTDGEDADYLGLFSVLYGTVYDLCLADVSISGGSASWRVGALCGLSDYAHIERCCANGTVMGGESVGGLCGSGGNGTIRNSSFIGSVSGESSVGGLCATSGGELSYCYAAAVVTGSASIGGLCLYADVEAVSHCFWDTDVSGIAAGTCGVGKTTVEMQSESTFTGAGWDFVGETTNGTDDIWYLYNGYPVLTAFLPAMHDLVVHNGSGSATHPEGASIAVVADAAPAGQEFVGWAADPTSCQANLADASARSTTFVMPPSDVTLTPAYTVITYTVTFDLGTHGTRTGGGELSQTVDHGTGATEPEFAVETGWTFTGWNAAVGNVTSDLSVTAQYAVVTYTVTFDLGIHGNRTGGGELSQTVDHGADAAEPEFTVEAGWRFTGWDVAFNNVTSDLAATAQYVRVYSLTVTGGSGDGSYAEGTDVALTADAPPAGQVFAGWTVDPAQYAAHLANASASSTTFTMPAADAALTATYADADPFGNPVIYPGTAMTVLVRVSRSQGVAESADVVGAFVDGELRGKASVTFVDDVPYVNLTVNVDGDGETIAFKLYDASADTTDDGNRTIIGAAGASLGTPAEPVEVMFGLATLEIELAPGWNQVSLNLRPVDPTCDTAFAGIASELQKAIGDGGNYTPGWGELNTLTEFRDGLGYWVKVSATTTWTVKGTLLDASATPIALVAGWNHIAFIGPSASTVDAALAGVANLLEKVVGDGGNYTPGWGALNTLATMKPGIGYWVKVSSATTLTYGFAAPARSATARADRATPDWTPVQPDPPATAHTIMTSVTLDGEPVAAGSKVGVFVNDECRAVGDMIAYNGDSYFNLTVRMGSAGETAAFRLYDATGDAVLDTEYTMALTPGESDGTPTEPVVIEFSSPVVQHTVTFRPGLHGALAGGSPDVVVTVDDGDPVPTAPTVTAEEGWTHVGWDWVSPERSTAPTAITGDWTATALYEEDAPVPVAWQLALALDGANPSTLTIGMRADATDGWDAGVDVQYPLPAPGQACLASDDLALSYSADFHALAETGQFMLLVSASEAEPAVVSWDASALPNGKYLTIYGVTLGEVSPDRAAVPRELVGNTGLNMALTSRLTVPAGETRSYVIRYGDDLIFDLGLEAGWNLISLPIEPNSPNLAVVLSDGETLRDGFRGTIHSGDVCTWAGQQYVDVTELHACIGYWIYVAEAQVLLVDGMPVGQTRVDLARGWNQCGVEAECEAPADARINGTPWVWNPLLLRYEPADVLRPGLGFWINANEDAAISLPDW
jgi:hypothetical protein